MKILVTGGSGFIGTNVIEYYLRKGHDVMNIDIKSPKYPEVETYWRKCDITDYTTLDNIVQDFSPNYIIHLAARTDLEGKTVDDYKANTCGTENILKAASRLKGLQKILITSSMLVCHTGYIPKNQKDYSPNTKYGESKIITEQLTWQYRPTCDWAILRPTSIWGPWFGIPYRNFFDMINKGLYVHIGHRSCHKTYGYIENAVYQINQILSTSTSAEENKVFYIGDAPAIHIEEWANQIAAELGKKVYRIPYWIIYISSWFGDILNICGIHFPMTSFRLRNMITDNIIPLDNTLKIAPNPPVDRITGIKRTLEWMKITKK